MSLTSDVNKILNTMHSFNSSEKGVYGEKAVLAICEDIYQRKGGILIHSYAYKTEDVLAGNIKRDGAKYYVENLGSFTEIDVLLVTPYKVFPIEVKAYKANKITLSNEKISGCHSTNKSPEHQNEMHCRHLYPHIYTALPDGCSNYIVPIVVFADDCTLADVRTNDRKQYIKVTILNRLRSLIEEYNKPYNGYMIDLRVMDEKLKTAMVSNEKYLTLIKQ